MTDLQIEAAQPEPAAPTVPGHDSVVVRLQAMAAEYPEKLFDGFSELMDRAKAKCDWYEVAYLKSMRDLVSGLARAFYHYHTVATTGAAPTVVEPVAWVDQETFDCLVKNQHGAIAYHRWLAVGAADSFSGRTIPLFAATPPRAALTDEQIDKIIVAQWGTHPSVIFKAHRAFARAVITADRGEK